MFRDISSILGTAVIRHPVDMWGMFLTSGATHCTGTKKQSPLQLRMLGNGLRWQTAVWLSYLHLLYENPVALEEVNTQCQSWLRELWGEGLCRKMPTMDLLKGPSPFWRS